MQALRICALLACLSGPPTFADQSFADQPSAEALLYGALPQGEGLRLSPDGRNLAMISPVKGQEAVVIWHLDGSDPSVFTSKEMRPEWLAWQSDRTLIAGMEGTGRAFVPYKHTVTAAFDVQGGGWTTLPPGLNLARPGAASQNEVSSLSALRSMGGATGPGQVPVPDLNSAISLMMSNRPLGFSLESSSSQFQDAVISLEPRGEDRILIEAWLPQNHMGAVISSDHAQKHAAVAEKMESRAVHWMADPQGRIRLKVSIEDGVRTLSLRAIDGETWQTLRSDPIDKAPLFGRFVFAPANLDRARAFLPLAFSDSDPNLLYVQFTKADGHLAIGAYHIDGGEMTTMAESAESDIQPLVRDRKLIGYRVGFGAIHYLNPTTAALAASLAKVMPGQDLDIVDVATDGKRILIAASPDQGGPPIYWMFDSRKPSPELKPALHPYPQIATAPPAQWVSIPARDGLAIPALLTQPSGAAGRRLPFVLLIHDGPTAHDSPGFDWLTHFIVSLGYGVLQPQFRGSTGFGLTLERAGDQEWGRKMQDDVTDATRWLARQDFADGTRICAAGRGYGGYSALMGAAREPGLYRCAAAIDAITDLEEFVGERPDQGGYERADYGIYRDINIARITRPEEDRTAPPPDASGGQEIVINGRRPTASDLQRISPLYLADAITAPVLLIHGRKDTQVAARQSEALEDRLKSLGKPVRSLYLKESDQAFYRQEDRIALLAALQSFLAANLAANNGS